MYLPSGTRLHNRYEIESVLGVGGFGITYLATDTLLKVKVAVKEYLPRQLATRSEGQTQVTVYTGEAGEHYGYGLKKFLEEAQALAQFAAHPNIVTCNDFFAENRTAYLVMHYIEGITLKEYLTRQGGTIPFETAIGIMMPVMDALREVHQLNLLHRDISPDNIFLTTDNQVKLLDFGAARYQAGEHSKSLSVILKPGYAPEEQYRSSGNQGPWTDAYAVAATIYKAVTGQNPPDALDRLADDTIVPPSQLGVTIPPAAEAVLLKALAVQAPQRFQTMGEFQEHLTGRSGAGMSTTVQLPVSPPIPILAGSSRVKKGRWQAAVLAASGIVGIALAGGLLWRAAIPSPPSLPASKVAEGEKHPGINPSAPQTVPPETRASQDFFAPPTEPAGATKQEFPKKWLLDWIFQQSFKGYLIITGQPGMGQYSGKLFTKSGRQKVVSMDANITLTGDRVFIQSSKPSVPGWSTDDFYLELKGAVMSGYSMDKTGRRGKAIFRGADESQFEAYLQREFGVAALMPKLPSPALHLIPPHLISLTASSVLPPSRVADYKPGNVMDGKETTAWVEGAAGNGIGEWIQLDFQAQQTVGQIKIVDGFGFNKDIFKKNGRVKTGQINFSDGSSIQINLVDHGGPQLFTFKPVNTTFVRFTIAAVYPGTKWDDTCISEIRVFQSSEETVTPTPKEW